MREEAAVVERLPQQHSEAEYVALLVGRGGLREQLRRQVAQVRLWRQQARERFLDVKQAGAAVHRNQDMPGREATVPTMLARDARILMNLDQCAGHIGDDPDAGLERQLGGAAGMK